MCLQQLHRNPMMNLSNEINISNNDWCALTKQIGRMDSEQVVESSSSIRKHCLRLRIPTPEPVAFTNYDVIFGNSGSNKVPNKKYTLTDDQVVGNRRFMVLLAIYRPRYLQAAEKGNEDECKRIALEIINTVCQQCSPQGRFFHHDDVNDDTWHQIEDESTLVTAVQCAIKDVPSLIAAPPAADVVVERPSKRVRSSLDLLCQAASKKLPSEPVYVSTPKPFDVICSTNQVTLKANANHVGNNRLQVILDIRLKAYESSSQDKRSTIVNDVVTTIIDDSSSQFLAAVDNGDGGASENKKYLPLSRENAAICIKTALDSKLMVVVPGVQSPTCGSEANQLVNRYYKKRALDKIERRRNKVFMDGDGIGRIPIAAPVRVTHFPKAA